MKTTIQFLSISLLSIMTACNGQVKKEEKEALAKQPPNVVKTAIGDITLPPPFATESKTNNSKVIGWPEGKTPIAPEGFTVIKFADGFENPRWTYIAPNNDIFVVESGTRTSKTKLQCFVIKTKTGNSKPVKFL